MNHIRFEVSRYPNGSFCCITSTDVANITFTRNGEGKIRWSSKSGSFSDAEFKYAFQVAARLIEENELRVHASAPLGIHRSKELEAERRRPHRLASKRARRESKKKLQQELDLFSGGSEPTPQPEEHRFNTTT